MEKFSKEYALVCFILLAELPEGNEEDVERRHYGSRSPRRTQTPHNISTFGRLCNLTVTYVVGVASLNNQGARILKFLPELDKSRHRWDITNLYEEYGVYEGELTRGFLCFIQVEI